MKTPSFLLLRSMLVAALLSGFCGVAAAQRTASDTAAPTRFQVRIENIAGTDGQLASDGSRWPFAVSPGLWVLHRKKAPLFEPGKKTRGQGLEQQAEDGNPELLARTLAGRQDIRAAGIFNVPEGASEPGPIGPGSAFAFTFEAEPGTRLSIVAMFGQSNDLFYAPDKKGIALFKDGQPVSGNITDQFILWDAGTEVNQEPGIGPDQAPRQSAPNTGREEEAGVRAVRDGFTYPGTTEVLRITITPLPPQAL